MHDDSKLRQGTVAWFEMVGTLMCEAASQAGVAPDINLTLIERYTDGVELTNGHVQGIRFEIVNGASGADERFCQRGASLRSGNQPPDFSRDRHGQSGSYSGAGIDPGNQGTRARCKDRITLPDKARIAELWERGEIDLFA
jgi:hypothetical protein